jgi:two-component sensor histidine kinase
VSEVAGQVHAIAQVYGLQVGAQGPLPVVGVVEAIAGSVQRNFGHPIRCDAAGARDWALPESEAIPIALTINELLTNAVKHSGSNPGEIACEVVSSDDGVTVRISNVASLPPGFGLARIPGSVSGLGLVRALLPRRHAALTIEQHGPCVVAAVALRRPVVSRPEAPSPTIREPAAVRRKERTP